MCYSHGIPDIRVISDIRSVRCIRGTGILHIIRVPCVVRVIRDVRDGHVVRGVSVVCDVRHMHVVHCVRSWSSRYLLVFGVRVVGLV